MSRAAAVLRTVGATFPSATISILVFVSLGVLVALAIADQSPHLIFSRKIGVDWKPEDTEWMNFVAISSDGSMVAGNGNVQRGKPKTLSSTGSNPELGLWTFPAGDFVRNIAGAPLAISADFRFLATETTIVDLQTGKSVFQIALQSRMIDSASFSPTGDYVAIAGGTPIGKAKRAQIVVRKSVDGQFVSKFCTRYTKSLAFHPDGRTLASGHWNNVTLWNAETGRKLALLVGAQRTPDADGYQRDGRYMCGIGFSHDGKMLAAGSDDGELQLWDVEARKLIRSMKIGWLDVSNPVFSPDGKLVAAGTYGDGTVSLRHLQEHAQRYCTG